MLIFRGILPEWMEDQLWMESSRVFKLMAFFWLAHRFTDRSCFKTLWLVVFLEGPWATKHRSLFFFGEGWMKDPLSVIWLVHFGQKDWRFTIQATNNLSLKILEDLESSNLQSRYPWRPPPPLQSEEKDLGKFQRQPTPSRHPNGGASQKSLNSGFPSAEKHLRWVTSHLQWAPLIAMSVMARLVRQSGHGFFKEWWSKLLLNVTLRCQHCL